MNLDSLRRNQLFVDVKIEASTMFKYVLSYQSHKTSISRKYVSFPFPFAELISIAFNTIFAFFCLTGMKMPTRSHLKAQFYCLDIAARYSYQHTILFPSQYHDSNIIVPLEPLYLYQWLHGIDTTKKLLSQLF